MRTQSFLDALGGAKGGVVFGPLNVPLEDRLDSVDRAKAMRLLRQGVNVNAMDYRGETALMLASKIGLENIVRELLKRGADVNMTGAESGTALTTTAANARGKTSMLRLLLANGANIDAQDDIRRTALMYAAAYGNVEMAGMLLDAGANPTLRDESGKTALQIAATTEWTAEAQRRKVVEQFRQAGVKE